MAGADTAGPDALAHDAGLEPPDAAGDAGAVDAISHDGGAPDGWALISPVSFSIGSPATEDCRSAYEEMRQVTLTRAFELQRTEVTQQQFLALMGYNPSAFGPTSGAPCGMDCPVENVTWYEAVAYCNQLSTQRGLTTCYDCTGTEVSTTCVLKAVYEGSALYSCPGYRLPTEAEWEYAYRAGTTTAYYNGDNEPAACYSSPPVDSMLDQIAWYEGNAGGTPHPVASKLPNAWGLFDMAGNASEYCHDRWSDLYAAGPLVDPVGPDAGTFRVRRGGNWNQDASRARAAFRSSEPPGNRANTFGFRCARSF